MVPWPNLLGHFGRKLSENFEHKARRTAGLESKTEHHLYHELKSIRFFMLSRSKLGPWSIEAVHLIKKIGPKLNVSGIRVLINT